MAGPELKALKKAIKNRRPYLLENLSTLTMKQFRKLLEQDMGLPDKALHEHKDFISQTVDSIVKEAGAQPASEAAEEQPAAKEEASEQPKKKAKKAAEAEAREQPKKKAKKAAEAEASEQPKKKAKKQAEAAPAKPAAEKGQANGAQHSKRFAKMKLVCKQAGVKVPPSIYTRKTPTQQEAALEALLEKHGLAWDSSPQEIAAAQRRLAKAQDLEGIDASNILEGGRRSRARVDYAAVSRTAYQGLSEGSSEEEEESDDGDDSSSDASAGDGGSDAENVSPANGRRQSGEAPDSEAEAEDGSDSDAAEASAGRAAHKAAKAAAKRAASGTPGQSGGAGKGKGKTPGSSKAKAAKPGKTPEAGRSPKAGKSGGSGSKRQAGGGAPESEASGGRPVKRRAVVGWSDDDE